MTAHQKTEVIHIDFAMMLALLTIGSVSDLKDYRIPNTVILSGWVMGLLFRFCRSGMAGIGQGIFCIVISMIALFPAYLIRAFGAGDVKMLSVISGMYGLTFWMRTSMVFAVLAALAALVHMILKGLFVERFLYFFHFYFFQTDKTYYDSKRDGRDAVIPLVPILTVSYCIICFCEQNA